MGWKKTSFGDATVYVPRISVFTRVLWLFQDLKVKAKKGE